MQDGHELPHTFNCDHGDSDYEQEEISDAVAQETKDPQSERDEREDDPSPQSDDPWTAYNTVPCTQDTSHLNNSGSSNLNNSGSSKGPSSSERLTSSMSSFDSDRDFVSDQKNKQLRSWSQPINSHAQLSSQDLPRPGSDIMEEETPTHVNNDHTGSTSDEIQEQSEPMLTPLEASQSAQVEEEFPSARRRRRRGQPHQS